MNSLEAPPERRGPDTIFASFERAVHGAGPERRALAGVRDGGRWVELSFVELARDVETTSKALASLGLVQGDVLCLQLPNWTEAVVYTYAAARLGVVVCPITTIYRQHELRFILRRTASKVLVVPSKYRGFDYAAMAMELKDSCADLEHVVAVGESSVSGVRVSGDLLAAKGLPDVPAAQPCADDLAVLAFTSGTTGEAKGVMHSHASMHAAIDDFVVHAGFGQGLTSLVMSPFGHLTGFTWGILMPIRGCGDVVLLETWDPAAALELTSRYGVTFTMGATPFLTDVLDVADQRPDARLPRMFVCAGAPIPPALIERASKRHGTRVVSGWGMSEYPIGTSTSVSDPPTLASSTDGRPAGRAQIRVVDGDGRPVQVGEEGDLLLRGPGLFRGYFRRPDLDKTAVVDGFLHTGDRARLLDEDGHIRISGRAKDLIIRGGENIPVVEIENLLLRHPGVREVALVPLPHERLGETACACVVAQPGYETQLLTVAELGRHLGELGVAKQFWPETLRILAELPRTPSGKIQKFMLRRAVTPNQTPRWAL